MTILQRLTQDLQGGPAELGERIQKQYPVMRQRNLARTGVASPPASPEVETVWCGARNGRRVTKRPSLSPAALYTLVTSMLSSNVSGGSILGSLRASMVLPEPGGPLISMYVRFATHPC